jgi:hypothetical protein
VWCYLLLDITAAAALLLHEFELACRQK